MSAIAVELFFILLLVLANGVLSMSELAVVSARKVRLKQRARKGDKRALAAIELASSPNTFLSTVQIGITLIGILAGAFGGATIAGQLAARFQLISWLAPYSEPLAIGIVVLFVTYLSLVLGELVPKRLALNNAEQIAATMARPMRVLSVVSYPVVRLLTLSTEAVLRLLGARPSTEPPVTEEEIHMMMREGLEAGVLEGAEHDIVKNVFRLGHRRVSSLMTPRHEIVWLDPHDSLDEIKLRVRESGHSRFPVCVENLDNLLGLVRAKDLLAAAISSREIDLRAILRSPLYMPENMRALKALEMFKKSGKHAALIVDEHGGIEGLITHHDILEAIVGDIPFTDDPPEQRAVRREDGSWLIDGTLSVEELKEILQIKRLPGEDDDTYQTLAGFVMREIGHVPKAGEFFEWNGLRFEVADMDGRRIDKVLIAPASTDAVHRTAG